MTLDLTDAAPEAVAVDEWELDITIVEGGAEADKLLVMTDDGCGSTCQSACAQTCP
jgi:FxLD family lantipeptide